MMAFHMRLCVVERLEKRVSISVDESPPQSHSAARKLGLEQKARVCSAMVIYIPRGDFSIDTKHFHF